MSTKEYIPLHILETITNNFSEHKKIGTGGYADVYKADYNERVVAVKLLRVDMAHGIKDELYINEVGNLLSVNHPNIVQLVGYCYETRSKLVVHNAERKLRLHIYRVLCFEYLQGGSLDKYVYDQSFAPNWSTRYNIIKGICEGLNFLHKCVPQILHLDLKPANILLDNFMKPKLADFGLSRIFTELHNHVTETRVGTRKHMPPEFINEGKISSKNDVFSLGVVMIEIMTGRPTGYSNSLEMGDVAQLMKKVLTKWSTTIEATSRYQSDELQQVKTCMELAIGCMDHESDRRPTIAFMLDTLNRTETHIPKKQMPDVLPCPTIVPKSTACNPLKTVIAQLDNTTMKHEHFNYMPKDSSSHNEQEALDRETASNVVEESIIGRTKEKQIILSILFENITEQMVILPIYGLGGIGKTTLAQLVYNDTQFQGYSQVWVYVSQKFDLNKIGNSIISQLTNKTSNIPDKQMLHKCLKELFSGNKILIVLDDLWEENQKILDELKAMLSLGLGRKVIIVTTRDGGIARKICSAITPYKLEILTVDMCWTIIKQKSNFEDRHDKKQLEQIGREIATKCGGLALAAQSLGYMLNDMKNCDEWESVRDSYIWNLSTLEGPSSGNNEVLESLLLSYSHMSYFLKLCFSYCAVFPKGHNIVKRDLIHQWIALGFIEPSTVFDSMQLCEKYVTQLLGRSFLQYSKSTLSGKLQDKDVILFTMHDLVHDLATETLADKVNKKGDAVGSSCHYALLTDCSEPLQLSRSSPENTRFKFFFNLFQERSTPENIKALFFLDCQEIELSGGAFSPAKCLRVLDLSECFIYKLPDSIGGLKQLRYLHAPKIQDSMIPNCITELSELTYLNLRGSENISAIPKSIGDLKGLRHLDLSGWVLLRELPVSFAELKQLVHLDLSYCIISEVEALGSCTKLKYLNLSGCYGISKLPKSFVELKQLVHLDLSNCRMPMSEDIGGLTKLQYLNLSHESYQMNMYRGGLLEIIGNLTDLRYLNLSQCLQLMTRSNDQIGSLLDSISTLSNLEHLYLSGNQKLSSIPESIGNLRKLLTLDLSRCNQLKKLPHSMDQMVTLKVLYMERHMRLDQSTLSRLNAPSLPHFLVYTSSDKCSSNISLLEHTNPKELTIDRLENVKSAAEAQSIQLIEKQNIQMLGFQWTAASERFVDDKDVLEQLVPPSSVQKLWIAGYRSVSIPDWVMGITQYTPHLYSLSLFDFTNCKILPPLGQLPNLRGLYLYRMESLEEWNTAYTSGAEGANELIFPKLRCLTIEQCPKLRIEPCLPRAILELEIIDSDNILSLLGKSSSHSGASSSSPITGLKVVDSKVPLHQWRLLHHLPDLCNLTIDCCSNLKDSPQILQCLSSLETLCLHQAELPRWLVKLTSLQELSLSKCRSMTSVPLWLGELISLRKLKIKDCEGIRALPDSIQELTELESVEIDGCPTLEKWCKSEENKMKLAHIIREKKWDPYEHWQNGTHT